MRVADRDEHLPVRLRICRHSSRLPPSSQWQCADDHAAARERYGYRGAIGDIFSGRDGNCAAELSVVREFRGSGSEFKQLRDCCAHTLADWYTNLCHGDGRGGVGDERDSDFDGERGGDYSGDCSTAREHYRDRGASSGFFSHRDRNRAFELSMVHE